jgi:hypothetical protein
VSILIAPLRASTDLSLEVRRMSIPQRLQDLYDVASKAAERFCPSPATNVLELMRVARTTGLWLPGLPLDREGVFDPCGLILEFPPKAGTCWCTPEKALTFAHTGGDGVHYSYLSSDELPPGLVPIVMTLPPCIPHNVVLAESIDEFLGLGYHVGWFALELVSPYSPESVLEYFAKPNPNDPHYKSERMEFLRSQLGIRPIALSLQRIAALTERYASYLIVPDDPPV